MLGVNDEIGGWIVLVESISLQEACMLQTSQAVLEQTIAKNVVASKVKQGDAEIATSVLLHAMPHGFCLPSRFVPQLRAKNLERQ